MVRNCSILDDGHILQAIVVADLTLTQARRLERVQAGGQEAGGVEDPGSAGDRESEWAAKKSSSRGCSKF